MEWISTNEPPEKDILCFASVRRADGSAIILYYPVMYTTGVLYNSSSPIRKGFLHPGVIAWLPIPESYTRSKNGWINIYADNRYPKKRGDYIVSTYDSNNRERVCIAFFEPEKLKWYGQPDVIAWMPIPNLR